MFYMEKNYEYDNYVCCLKEIGGEKDNVWVSYFVYNFNGVFN